MNFNDASSDRPVGSKDPARKAKDEGHHPGESHLDKTAMEGAQKAQDRQHKNENTNSGNTIFSK